MHSAPVSYGGGGSLSRSTRGVLAVLLLVWLVWTLPLALGQETLFFRDVFTTHLPLKAFGAEQLRQGDIPAFNPSWGLGQPFRGNPNAVAFYPGNLLYLVLPFWSAFNLHYALHWLVAACGMALLARRMGQGPEGAAMAAVTYAGSGWVLSALSFYNILTVTAWWPWVMAGAAVSGMRGVALGGAACGLALLGGEPVTALLGMVPVCWVGLLRFGPRRALLRAVGVGLVGLTVALPQVVASLRVVGHTVRGAGLGSGSGLYLFHPLRLLELLLPLPFGRPGDFGPTGFWATEIAPRLPYVLSVYVGAVGLALALGAAKRYRSAALLAAAGLLGAWLGGLGGDLTQRMSAGLVRYPEKFLFWFALVAPLLAGWGLERVRARPGGWPRAVAVASGAACLALVSLGLGGGWAVRWLQPHLRPGSLPGTSQTQVALWLVALFLLTLLLALAAWAGRRRSAALLVALQALGLAQLAPLLMTTDAAPYRQGAPWAVRLGPGTAVASGTVGSPFLDPEPRYRTADTSFAERSRLAALDLDPAPGLLSGLTYPLAPDLEGMHSPLFGRMLYTLPLLDAAGRVAWLRALGVEAISLPVERPLPGLEKIDEVDRAGVRTGLYRVPGTAPEAWWPQRLEEVAVPELAFARIAQAADPTSVAVVAGGRRHHPEGWVQTLSAGPDRIEMEVESGGGILVVRRAYQPLLEARAGDAALETFPVNLNLLGVAVPEGRQRVTIRASAGAERWAGGLAVVALVAALFAGLRRER